MVLLRGNMRFDGSYALALSHVHQSRRMNFVARNGIIDLQVEDVKVIISVQRRCVGQGVAIRDLEYSEGQSGPRTRIFGVYREVSPHPEGHTTGGGMQ